MNAYIEQLYLRAPEPEDLEVMLSFENDMSSWMDGTAVGLYSRYQLKRFIAENQNDIYIDRQLRLMVEHPTDGVVAMVDLCTFDPRHNRAEVGIVVRSDRRHRGIGRKSLQLLETYCFVRLGIYQLYAYIAAGNVYSLALFRREGYIQSGCLRHWLYTSEGYTDVFFFQKFRASVE